jgi:hypothetical protein
MNHDLTVNTPSKHIINIIASSGMGDNRLLVSCVSDAHINSGDTLTVSWQRGHIVKVTTVEVLESQLWVSEHGREFYINLVQIDR